MLGVRLKAMFAPSVSKRIAGGFAVLLALLAGLAVVTFRLLGPLDTAAVRVGGDSARAEAATAVALQFSDARLHVAQYALSATLFDQKAAQDSLVTLDQSITTAAGGRVAAGLAALTATYRGSVDSTFAAVEARRASIERMQTASTEIHTITSAIAQALAAETDADLVRSGLLLAQSFQESDIAASRFLASRNPADANIALNAVKAVPAQIDELTGLAGENRRLRRFIAALEKPLAGYVEGLLGVLSSDDQLRLAAAARRAASEAVLGAAAAESERAAESQREAVASMLAGVGSVRSLLLVASLATIGVGLALAVLIGRSAARRVAVETEQAATDAMTGLANRRRFDEALDQEWRRACRGGLPISMLMLDADCFKLYNDRYGHPMGDQALRAIATSIQAAIRRAGDVGARYGGEEFAVILPNTSAEGAMHVAAAIRNGVAALAIPHLQGPAGILTVSVGAASTVATPDTAAASLLASADEALYAAKAGGRNQAVHASTIGQATESV